MSSLDVQLNFHIEQIITILYLNVIVNYLIVAKITFPFYHERKMWKISWQCESVEKLVK